MEKKTTESVLAPIGHDEGGMTKECMRLGGIYRVEFLRSPVFGGGIMPQKRMVFERIKYNTSTRNRACKIRARVVSNTRHVVPIGAIAIFV